MPSDDTSLQGLRQAGPLLDAVVFRMAIGLSEIVGTIPSYSTDLTDAWQLVELFSATKIERVDDGWSCNLTRSPKTEDTAETLPLAITLAAVAACQHREDSGLSRGKTPWMSAVEARPPSRARIEDEFWARVDRRAADECWLWVGMRNPAGYGVFSFDGKQLTASRVSYMLASGESLKGFVAAHRCDNPPCVNPAHLFKATVKENMQDAMAKGRLKNRNRRMMKAGIDNMNTG